MPNPIPEISSLSRRKLGKINNFSCKTLFQCVLAWSLAQLEYPSLDVISQISRRFFLRNAKIANRSQTLVL